MVYMMEATLDPDTVRESSGMDGFSPRAQPGARYQPRTAPPSRRHRARRHQREPLLLCGGPRSARLRIERQREGRDRTRVEVVPPDGRGHGRAFDQGISAVRRIMTREELVCGSTCV